MIIKIEKDKYYGYNNKTKELFKKKYRSLKLKWMESVKLGDEVVDGWFDDSMKQYLLKLPEEGNMKRFTGNSIGMIEFLKNRGAVVSEGEERGVHINYDDKMGFVDQIERYGNFIGADLVGHYRAEEILRGMMENWGVRWSEKRVDVVKDDKVIKLINKKLISESLKNKKRRIIRRIKK